MEVHDPYRENARIDRKYAALYDALNWLVEKKKEIWAGVTLISMFCFVSIAFSSCMSCIDSNSRKDVLFNMSRESCKEEIILISEKADKCNHRFAKLIDTGTKSPQGASIYVCKCPEPEPVPEELTK